MSAVSGGGLPSGLSASLVGGRLSVDSAYSLMGAYPMMIVAPSSPEDQWRALRLDEDTLGNLPASRLVPLLVDLSPDMSRGQFDFLRFCNPGYTIRVLNADAEESDRNAAPNERGKQAMRGLVARLDRLYGSFDVPINRLFTSVYQRGAFMLELVLDKRGREPIDLATPDPNSVRFLRANDPERGQVWVMGQWQGGTWVALDRPTIGYVPLDPLPGSPFGRAPILSAIFPTIFLLGLLHDLRRVIAQQGYPRLDVEIDLDALKEAIPIDKKEDWDFFKAELRQITAQIEDAYRRMKPDQAYVHSSLVKVNQPVGANQTSLAGIGNILDDLEHVCVRALKTMPLLQGLSDNVSEANSNRQWEVHAATIKAVQHLVETQLSVMFTLGLQSQGIPAKAIFRFAELRSSELLRDAQVDRITTDTAWKKYQYGLSSWDEFGEMAIGHQPAEAEPRIPLGGGTGPDNGLTPAIPGEVEPGSARLVLPDGRELLVHRVRPASRQIDPLLADDLALLRVHEPGSLEERDAVNRLVDRVMEELEGRARVRALTGANGHG